MDYAYVLRRAWQTLWRWKVLWLLGFLAALRPRTPNNGWNDLPIEAQHRLAEFATGPYYVPVIVAAGFVDTFRYRNPDTVKYSWWSYRAGARKRNIGWRIDYFLVSSVLKAGIGKADILNEIMGSDHCPVLLELNPAT